MTPTNDAQLIARGTTPTITVEVIDEVPFEFVEKFAITISQNHVDLIKKVTPNDAVDIDSDKRTISVFLTQEETLKLDARYPCAIQIKALNKGRVVWVTELASMFVYPVEDEEVMSDE